MKRFTKGAVAVALATGIAFGSTTTAIAQTTNSPDFAASAETSLTGVNGSSDNLTSTIMSYGLSFLFTVWAYNLLVDNRLIAPAIRG